MLLKDMVIAITFRTETDEACKQTQYTVMGSCKICKAMGTRNPWYLASFFSWFLKANPLRHINEAKICFIYH